VLLLELKFIVLVDALLVLGKIIVMIKNYFIDVMFQIYFINIRGWLMYGLQTKNKGLFVTNKINVEVGRFSALSAVV
jgi:hypothetical protein